MGENAALKHYLPQGSKGKGTKSTPSYSKIKPLSFAYSIITTKIIIKSSCKLKKTWEGLSFKDRPTILTINHFSGI